MGLSNHTLEIFENNRNEDPQSYGCYHFGIYALWGILGRLLSPYQAFWELEADFCLLRKALSIIALSKDK